jgi:molybdopterin-guanine dinucleotide biosynthesis protein B
MALVKPIIFQVVGYQNSGKTTFITNLIKDLTLKGLKTVTIKHHGHGGQPEAPKQKDTSKHILAGAAASIIEGEGRLLLHADNQVTLEEQINLLGYFQPDIMIIEGHKQANYPKVLLLKNLSDISLIELVNNIKLVLYWQKEIKSELESKITCPMFSIDDPQAIDCLVKEIKNHVHKVDEKS